MMSWSVMPWPMSLLDVDAHIVTVSVVMLVLVAVVAVVIVVAVVVVVVVAENPLRNFVGCTISLQHLFNFLIHSSCFPAGNRKHNHTPSATKCPTEKRVEQIR